MSWGHHSHVGRGTKRFLAATSGSGPPGELVLNEKVAIAVDGVRGDRATLSVWRVD